MSLSKSRDEKIAEWMDELTELSFVRLKSILTSESDDKTALNAIHEVFERKFPKNNGVITSNAPLVNIDMGKVLEGLEKVKKIGADE
jgi:hypothetical protein